MPVTITPQDLLDAAYGLSIKNNPGTIATESTELLQVIIRAFRGLYAFAARINPTFFATTSSVAFSSPGWARPETAESVFRIENPSNAEVVVVPYNQRKAETGKPAVYRYGQIYRGAGNANDPASGNLTFFFSKRPTDPATLTAVVDSMWVESYNQLPIVMLGLYLAIKEARAEEIPYLTAERDYWAQLFAAFLEHETVNERRSYGHINRFNAPSLVSVMSLLHLSPKPIAA